MATRLGGRNRALTRVAPDDADLIRQWYDVHRASFEHDHAPYPDDPWEEWRAVLARREHDTDDEWWLATLGTTPVGALHVELPLLDNRDVALVEIEVHPDARRRGIGSALLEHAVGRARQAGRHRIVGEVGQPQSGAPSAGSRFASGHGAVRQLEEVRRLLDLATVDSVALHTLREEASQHAADYETVQWVGATPEEYVAGVAAMAAQLSEDAPLDDLAWETEHWDAARVGAREERPTAVGRVIVNSAARHRGSGRLVAHSEIAVSRHAPETGYQWTTIVAREHRGHRLGTLLKVDNLEQLRRVSPRTRFLHTWNAASNPHMIGINEALGFRPVERWAEWELHV